MATARTHLFHRPEECDSFQPCFFEHDDVEFYGTCAPMPSDEIWEKFELLPTPPRSPVRESDPLPLPDLDCQLLDSDAEKLDLNSLYTQSLLTDLPEDIEPVVIKAAFSESPPSHGISGLNSKLIQDCMWSGRNVQFFTPESNSESKKTDKVKVTQALSSTRKVSRSDSDSVSGVDLNASSECVDPSVVFPYPMNVNREYPEMDTPSDSGDEDEEEEEIDVVNVEKIHVPELPVKRKASPSIHNHPVKVLRKPVTKVATSVLLPAVHACHTYSKQIPPGREFPASRSTNSSPVHNQSSVKRTNLSMPSSPQCHRISKRSKLKRHLTTPAELNKVAQKLKSCKSNSRNGRREYYSSSSSGCSSRVGSDSEGETGGKRTQHNVLERKRRNDLKYSFFMLRDAVPELCQQERAPKVVILKKATDYINDLTFKHSCLISDIEKQKARQEQLKRTLQLLEL